MQIPDDVAGGYASARAHMVDGQIRPNRVTDRRLLEVLRSMPREQFLPEALRPLAYIDDNLPLGDGRVLMEPLILARLLQLGRARPGERVLVVGAGVGYGVAVLAGCGASVVGLEEQPALLAVARATCASLGAGRHPGAGPARGWPPGWRPLWADRDRGRGARHPSGAREPIGSTQWPAGRRAGRRGADAAGGDRRGDARRPGVPLRLRRLNPAAALPAARPRLHLLRVSRKARTPPPSVRHSNCASPSRMVPSISNGGVDCCPTARTAVPKSMFPKPRLWWGQGAKPLALPSTCLPFNENARRCGIAVGDLGRAMAEYGR